MKNDSSLNTLSKISKSIKVPELLVLNNIAILIKKGIIIKESKDYFLFYELYKQ